MRGGDLSYLGAFQAEFLIQHTEVWSREIVGCFQGHEGNGQVPTKPLRRRLAIDVDECQRISVGPPLTITRRLELRPVEVTGYSHMATCPLAVERRSVLSGGPCRTNGMLR